MSLLILGIKGLLDFNDVQSARQPYAFVEHSESGKWDLLRQNENGVYYKNRKNCYDTIKETPIF